jgi:alpha-glucosidase (family GH31 glycosyl hydrolase)
MHDDAEAWADSDAFVLGERILVAPIASESEQRNVRVPQGDWLDWWQDTVHTGPTTLQVRAPLDTLPIYVRADPRLMTAVDADDPQVADQSRFGDSLVVRSSAGPTDTLTYIDGSTAQQNTSVAGSVVLVHNEHARRTSVDFHVRSDAASVDGVLVSVNAQVVSSVSSEQELWDCQVQQGACFWHSDRRILVSAYGTELEFEFAARP